MKSKSLILFLLLIISGVVSAATFDGDNLGEVFVLTSLGDVIWYEAAGPNNIVHRELVTNYGKAIAVGDFDGDDKMDLFILRNKDNEDKVWWYEADTVNDTTTLIGTFGTDIRTVALDDVDGDGDKELLLGREWGIEWYKPDGDNKAKCVEISSIPGYVDSICIVPGSGPQTEVLTGGTVTFGQKKIIETTPRWENDVRVRNDMQFMFAERFNDGTIWLTHSKGLHGPDEEGCYDISTDNGQTWLTDTGRDISGFITAQRSDNYVVSLINGWDTTVRYNHEMRVYIWDPAKLADPNPAPSSHLFTLNMAYPSEFLLHRSMIRLNNGKLLACGYGSPVAGDTSLDKSFCIESNNNGIGWYYKGTMGDPTVNPLTPLAPEGYSEPCLVELANGDLLCLMRTGNDGHPLMQAKSTDGGLTWSTPVEVSGSGSVAPTAKLLSNGTLVATSGRPDLYMLVDFTGTGNNWQEVELYYGPTCAYASIIEVAPNEIMIIFAQSDFCSYEFPDYVLENKIVGQYITIQKD